MAKHNDATGYLLAHRDAVRESWFHAVCDAAISSSGQALSGEELDRLWRLFHGSETYTFTASAPAPLLPPVRGAIPPFYLESLSGFSEFKKLRPTLKLDLAKRITLVFGRNGAGKSSLCQALKVLANPEKPKEPLHNVLKSAVSLPSFSFKLRGQLQTTWTELDGFGTQAQALKYFDATVAFNHVNSSIRPEAVVELSVFRLECFDYARECLKQFQSYGTSLMNQSRSATNLSIAAVKAKAQSAINVQAGTFKDWSAINCQPMLDWIRTIVYGPMQEQAKTDAQTRLAQLTAASSAEGQQSLAMQRQLIAQVKESLTTFRDRCSEFSYSKYADILKLIQQKEAASVELGGTVFTPNYSLPAQQALLSSAAAIRPFSPSDECVLCRQSLAPEASALFAAYHEHLNSTLQSDLSRLRIERDSLVAKKQLINEYRPLQYSQYEHVINPAFLIALASLIDSIREALTVPVIEADAVAAFQRRAELDGYLKGVSDHLDSVDSAIALSASGQHNLNQETSRLSAELGSLAALVAAHQVRPEIEQICIDSIAFEKLSGSFEKFNFTARLAALTGKKKEAHSELVLSSFIPHLNQEYKRLCGASLEQMGVRLANQGTEAIVLPKIGGELVQRVLSEGELKVHALALFMCEASVSSHQVLVLDDPVTSFDYNYVSNFCERLRDYCRDNPTSQVIVLTHNWDFFSNLQATINGSGLNNHMSVQVLEGCSTVAEYTEKWDELCAEIEAYFGLPTEPTVFDKEKLSALLRRLVEKLMNAYVFNEQRHQYKIKALTVSNFKDYTKLVPLFPAEADRLKDLYANLSPLEHDDLRNYYSGKTIFQFQTWYGEIKNMKAQLELRRPR
ncbi:AAA family ATPase [Pseudomonas viridiflava]|uniref:AAA family ATPase n=1 Tax=Pseudomonas viridiflava TaxID=33069 RepID=UPI000F022AD8|nr:AAA family ATPase [Pseudomonas viridiflava]